MQKLNYLTRNNRGEKGIDGERFSEIAFTGELLRVHRVVAASGDRNTCVIMCTSDGEIFLFKVPISSLDRAGDTLTLSVFYAKPQIYTVQPTYEEKTGKLVFQLQCHANMKEVDPNDAAFSNPPETLRHPPSSEQDSSQTGGARFFVMRSHAFVTEEWDTLPTGSDTSEKPHRIAIAGQLKDYFVVLENGDGYVLYGIPEMFIKPILYQVIQIRHVLYWKKERGFFFPDIRRADAAR